MKKIARKHGIEATDGTAESLPYVDSRFDFALMVTTICFLNDIEAVFKDAHRVLKLGGSLIIGFVDKESALRKQYLKHKNESLFYGIATFFYVNKVVFSLQKAFFTNYTFKQTIFSYLD